MKTCDGYCGKTYSESELAEYNNKEYCNTCYVKIKNEGMEFQSLKNYIQYIFKFRPNKQMLGQIKKYNSEEGWSYKNIRLTLEYIVVIKEIKMEAKYGIGLVPYYYDDMIAFHKKRLKRAKEIEDSVKKSKHITVNKKQDSMHKYNKGRMVDIEELDEDDE